MSTRHNRMREGGFSLVELVIVTLVFGIIVTGALGFMATQNNAFNKGADRLVVLENLRYAYQALDMDLSTVGSNVPAGQPPLVLAGADVVAFTGDYTSNLVNDFAAVYVDVDAPSGTVQVPQTGVSLPNSTYSWPDTLYTAPGGTPSMAELIIFYFEPDTTTARTDDWVLMRQINDASPEVLARDLLKQGSTPFFRYFRERALTDGGSSLDSIPDSELPLFHAVKIHGSADDTGNSAKADLIRAVRVTFRSTNGRTGDAERLADVSRVIDLPNAGVDITESCGDEPLLGNSLNVNAISQAGARVVRIRWNQAVDEATGEQDVVRYLLYRRPVPNDGSWGDPFLSVPSGDNNYMFIDRSVKEDSTYQYVHAAQDCTPALSALSSIQQITVN